MSKKFTRTPENFTCDNCGIEVVGNGFTDHCPQCLYSKHVDINPGDREAQCLGAMKPVGIAPHKNVYKIYYICEKCGYTHTNKSSGDDNISGFLETHNPFKD